MTDDVMSVKTYAHNIRYDTAKLFNKARFVNILDIVRLNYWCCFVAFLCALLLCLQ